MTCMKVIPDVGWENGLGHRTSFQVRNVYELLDVVRQKSGLFIGHPSLTALNGFVQGFTSALHSVGNPFEQEEPPFEGFHDWIAARFGYGESTRGWTGMLLESIGDESAAFERFFSELDEFRRARLS